MSATINEEGYFVAPSGLKPRISIRGPLKIADKHHPGLDKNWDNMPEEMVWTPGLICQNGHFFQVEFSPGCLGNESGTYCRPVQPYETSEFEQLFAFGGHCHGFSTDVVILLRDTYPY